MRRLFFDIETSPNIGLFWECGYKLNIPHDNIVKERAIICIGYKWSGESKVHSLTWDDDQEDQAMLAGFIPLMDDADELVTQNGDRFDIPWIRTRALHHGIPMSPNHVSIDTYKAAKYKFRFNSNRLDYLGQFMGEGKKIKTDFDLWKAILLKNDRKALTKMVTYCKQDVRLLEKVWDKMNPYVPAKSHVGHGLCPECGSRNVTINKHRLTAMKHVRVCYQCQDCGKYHTVAEGGRLGKALQEAS